MEKGWMKFHLKYCKVIHSSTFYTHFNHIQGHWGAEEYINSVGGWVCYFIYVKWGRDLRYLRTQIILLDRRTALPISGVEEQKDVKI